MNTDTQKTQNVYSLLKSDNLVANSSINPDHNLYVIRSYGKDGSLIKIGKSKDIKARMNVYLTMNPLIELVDTFYREDANTFENIIHKVLDPIFLREWYDESKLPLIIDYLTGVKDLYEDFRSLNIGENSGNKIDNKINTEKRFLDDNLNVKTYGNTFKSTVKEYLKAIKNIENGIDIDNNQNIIKDIETQYLIVKKGYELFGDKLDKKSNNYSYLLREIEIEQRYIDSIDQIKNIIKGFKYEMNTILIKSQVKDLMQSIYNDLNIEKIAKSNDIEDFVKVKSTTQTIDGAVIACYKVVGY